MSGSNLGPAETIIIVLIIGGLVAFFMLFLRHDAPFAHSNAFGRHLNFDNYHMDTIVKTLYSLTLLVNTIVVLAGVYIGFERDYDNQNTLAILLAGVLAFAVLQFLSRMIHEAIIMYVHMAQDVRGIRDALGYNRVPPRVAVNPEAERQNDAPKPNLADRASAARATASKIASAAAAGIARAKEEMPSAGSAREHGGRPAAGPGVSSAWEQPSGASFLDENPAVVPVAPAASADPVAPVASKEAREGAAGRVATDEPFVCDSCGTLVYGGKFCPKCGTPRG